MPKKKASGTPRLEVSLRQQAERRLAKTPRRRPAVPNKNAAALLHELQVHHVEPEMQNESLRETQVWLADARDRYVDLFEFAPVAYLSLNREHVVQEANLTAATIFGVDRHKLIGTQLEKWVARKDRDACTHHFQSELTFDDQKTCELSMLRGDNSPFSGQLKIVPVMSHGSQEVTGWRMTISDITARKKVEEELARAKEMAQKANLAKSRFLANVSHELRTPMSTILGMTQLALGEEISATVRDYLETIKQSGESLLELLNDLLDFSRIEEGKVKLESAAFSLRRVLSQIMKSMSVRALEKRLELTQRVPDDVPDDLVGDPFRLRQVLVNLVGNAVKFTHEGRVGVSVQTQLQTARDVRLQFVVADTGIGIPPQDQERIFAPFTQADASTTRSYGGSGLGLAISADLVKLMGGTIWLESRPGHGSTFYFTVGLKRAAAGAVAGAEVRFDAAHELLASPSARQLRILVAEDVPPNQKLVAAILRKRGHMVTLANDGHEAVEAAAHDHFDVILLDVQMPVVDGFQAAAAIRAMASEGRRPPLVAMTAYAMKDDVKRCITAGFDDYLGKPFKAEELIQTVERLADQPAAAGMLPATPPKAKSKHRRAAAHARRDEAHDAARYVADARKRCFDDAMFDEMVEFFFAESPSLLEEMQAAAEQGNAVELVRAAHRLKATVAYLGTPAALHAVARVEEIGLSGKLADAPPAIEQLVIEMQWLREVLGPHRRQVQQKS
jgi:PAS domain S-box-containing protein